ncbi:hypothetical protein ABZ942_16150 [Nocardia sp. NPDC046473]|uniref:hypothetical protein n=1 Tax=Nocardia sp. NPDC046473 TaxID=3155733 RepID=UPI0033C96341
MRTPRHRIRAHHSQFRVTDFTADYATTDADRDGWEVVEESDADDGILYRSSPEEPPHDPIPSGRFLLPAYAGGLDATDTGEIPGFHTGEFTEYHTGEFTEYHTGEFAEDHQPRHAAPACGVSRVRLPRKTGNAPAPVPTDQVRIDYGLVYVVDDNGDVRRVTPDHPLAQAVYERTRQWGLRPPSPALAGIVSAYYLSALGPGLLEDVEALTPEWQRAFARWSVHRAFERAGLADVDWIREGLLAMDDNQPPPPHFQSSARLRHRLDSDTRISKTVVSGVPGSSAHIQQYPPVGAYFSLDNEDPLEAALDAFRYAAWTYGMGYRDLMTAAERDFFPWTRGR